MKNRLEELNARLTEYRKCESEILNGAQSYSIGKRNLQRADLKEIAEMINYLERQIAIEEAKTNKKGKNAVIGIVPRDL